MEKRGLGKGLTALIADTMAADGEAQVRNISIEQIAPNPYQPRALFDPTKLEELVASIKEHGVLQPVLVRCVGHEQYQLVAGERRFRASQAVGLTTIPALVKKCSDRELLEMAVVENIQREDIGPIEAARAYYRLRDEFGMTQEAISQRVGKSRSSITNTMRLLDLPMTVQEKVERGEISEGHGRALLGVMDEWTIRHALQTVLDKRLSVRETEELVKEMQAAAGSSDVDSPISVPLASNRRKRKRTEALAYLSGIDANETAITDQLQHRLRTKVVVRYTSGGGGRIEIEFYNFEDRDRLVDILVNGRYSE